MIPVASSFDPTTVLTALGLGKYAASVIVLLAFIGYLITHLLPYLPPPTATSPTWWAVVYRILNGIAGNYGNAKSPVGNVTKVTEIPAPPPVTKS
jgi:hypothetical protein